MTRLSLTLLGGFAARCDSSGPLATPLRRAQALIASLAGPRGPPLPRDKLAALLWDELPREAARARLRHTLFVIRRAFGDTDVPSLRMDTDTVTLEPDGLV